MTWYACGIPHNKLFKHTLEGYILNAECFLICLELLFALYFNFWHMFRRFLTLNLIRLHDAWTPDD